MKVGLVGDCTIVGVCVYVVWVWYNSGNNGNPYELESFNPLWIKSTIYVLIHFVVSPNNKEYLRNICNYI